jgi:hypothetical protein
LFTHQSLLLLLLLLLLVVALVPSSSSMGVFLRREEGETGQEEEQLRFRRTNHSGSRLKEKEEETRESTQGRASNPIMSSAHCLPACLPTTMRARFFTFYCA